jgi:hypothetical protein
MRKRCLIAAIVLATTFASGGTLAQESRDRSRWMVGGYVGSLAHQGFTSIVLFAPWTTRLEPSYLAALNVTYLVYDFKNLPMSLEVDAMVAKRFGQDHEWEIAALPMVRWKALPWNSFVYTNIRLGLLGVSYVSGISVWERSNSGNGRGSRLLNLMVPEITVSSGPYAPWEVFLRVHHRSGGWGFINGVSGGSNYVSVGFRGRL